jgi:non-lysosomal glucosylceramidase
MPESSTKPTCGCAASSCGSGATRRQFLELAGASAAAAWLGGMQAVAGPFAAEEFEHLVPADKRLSAEWLESLTARGTPTVYRGAELDKIGMPVGGICAGQLYLGGDGRLWHWDIFNQHIGTGAEHYANPLTPASPLAQGFALRIVAGAEPQIRALDRSGWREIAFRGEYPIGAVDYRDAACPLGVRLEAFSPFSPLNTDDSSLPATVLQFTVTNHGTARVEAQLAGWLENAVCLHSAANHDGLRRHRVVRGQRLTFLEATAEPPPPSASPTDARPDVVFEDFEQEAYTGWQATGTAFGTGPIEKAKIPQYQGDVGAQGQRLVNTHNTRQGEDVRGGDAHVGTLTSREFVIERNFINFLIGGGAHAGRTCMNLIVDDRVVASATGANNNRMQGKTWNVRSWLGKSARLQIVDDERGGWGNVGVDQIVFSDRPRIATGPLQDEADFGTMGLALLDPQNGDAAAASLGELPRPDGIFAQAANDDGEAVAPFGQPLIGALTRTLALEPGQSATVTFLVAWHFPNLRLNEQHGLTGRYYARRFPSARAVAEYLAANLDALAQQTRLWRDTWYDSTLPYWFLDRTFANTSTLATSTCFRFASGRFWGWEGVGCCAGTCAHVWHYAHAVGRLFPDLERIVRERVDFGLAQREDGAILFRGEFNTYPAADGQAGCILRACREHQMSADSGFLQRIWPGVRRAIEYLIREDGDGDGLLEGRQHNTLDADWYGPVAWLSSLYLAALAAGEQLAREVGETVFAERCRAIREAGRTAIVERLFEDDYFINRPDPQRPEAINSGTGCHIDQVFGQSWAFQVGLDRVLPEPQTQAALRSLWRYNFTPDVGPYREAHRPGRWYAMPGEGGLLMCTFPRADWNYDKAKGRGADWAAGYFNECMNGFEYQVAGHMIWEGLVTEGLAITRMVHDRYDAARRNPWNEVECGDHYARSMASFGVYLAACGYAYHGPRGHLAFAPRLTPDNFRAAFTAAEGWGTFSQQRDGTTQTDTIEVKSGRLRLASLEFALADDTRATTATVTAARQTCDAAIESTPGRVRITLAEPLTLEAGDSIQVVVS